MSEVECRGVSRRFASRGGIERIHLAVEAGERVALVGPSGAGKSTLLRLIAGLEDPDSGSIHLGRRDVTRVAPSLRGIALTLQGQPPYPHLDVARNLGFSLQARRTPRDATAERVRLIAAGLGISDLLARRPATLSGGERQRVVLGRAIAAGASLTLLDEPFAALDAPLRASIRADLARLHERVGGTWIIVTHDQAEAMAFGQRVAVLIDGRLAQVAAPDVLQERPADRGVAAFLTTPASSLLSGRVDVRTDGVMLEGLVPGASWRLPESLGVVDLLRHRGPGPIELRVEPSVLLGSSTFADEPGVITVGVTYERREWAWPLDLGFGRLGEQPIRFWLDRHEKVAAGERLVLRISLASALWFDPRDQGRRLGGT